MKVVRQHQGSSVRERWLVVSLLIVLGLQVGVLGDVFNAGAFARLANLVTLATFAALSLWVLIKAHRPVVFFVYLLPLFFVLAGVAVNILRSGPLENLGYFGMTIPWLAAIAVPFATRGKGDEYWHWYYRFMLLTTLASIAEYGAAFIGVLPVTLIETDRGEFLKGFFTIFHNLGDDVIYGRMYGVFPEPGTYAMYLLLAIAYCLTERKWAALLLFLSALFMTGSLGGGIGLVALSVAYALFGRGRTSASRLHITTAAILCMLVFVWKPVGTRFAAAYEQKGLSAEVREDNVQQFLMRLPTLAVEAPIGHRLSGSSLSSLEAQDAYTGSNFTPAAWFALGGVMSLFGYVGFLLTNVAVAIVLLIRPREGAAERAVALSLPVCMLFLAQRTTPLDTAVFGFLFGGVMVSTLNKLRLDWPTGARSQAAMLARAPSASAQ